ncbi:hypothetical protein [Marinitoga sp. 38H-ov]|uniref:hypothetical protein n=1 Tax=Marinitoga sp. 38H-ov TaxID=1755814 RepID=UPI0013EE1D90|nr:hypothetical protein [Marinitoga sp. 38H-ov]KAF2955644.1 hypothetical protein AS160_00595 [Marinitoga sp. 38H-ov]
MATLKIHNNEKKRKKIILKKEDEKHSHEENINHIISGNAGIGWLKIVFSSFNFLISLILLSFFFIINFQKTLIQSMIGDQFSFNVLNIIILTSLFFIYSIIEQLNAIYYLKGNYKITKYTAILKLFISLIMIFTIIFIIFKSGIQWFGISLFGNTSLGKNQLFYIPSIIYLTYSIFLSLLSYYDLLK